MTGRDIAIVALVVVGVLVLLPLLGGMGMMGGWGMMGGPWSGGGWGWMGGMQLLGFLFWVLVLVGVGFVVTSLVRRDGAAPPAGPGEAPLEILKRRLAKGEITREEYDALKKELS
ncbi:MAG: SHOCT domain-containing protein [Armatimonadota bacterium]